MDQKVASSTNVNFLVPWAAQLLSGSYTRRSLAGGLWCPAAPLRPDSFVATLGYGECWTGDIPTAAAFADRFNHDWRWIGPGAEPRIRAALERVLKP